MSQDTEAKPTPRQGKLGSNYLSFAIKTLIATIFVSLGFLFVASSIVDMFDLQPVRNGLRKALGEEKTRIRLTGLLTTNPAVHYRVSLIEERDGNMNAAIDELELALGLLELHSVDRATREKYQSRLQELKRKLNAPGEKNTSR